MPERGGGRKKRKKRKKEDVTGMALSSRNWPEVPCARYLADGRRIAGRTGLFPMVGLLRHSIGKKKGKGKGRELVSPSWLLVNPFVPTNRTKRLERKESLIPSRGQTSKQGKKEKKKEKGRPRAFTAARDASHSPLKSREGFAKKKKEKKGDEFRYYRGPSLGSSFCSAEDRTKRWARHAIFRTHP